MSVKKVLLIVVSLCLVAAGIIGFYAYRKLHQPSLLPAHIPASSEAVVYINFKSVYNRFLRHKDSAVKVRKFKSPYLQWIKDPLSSGIDFLSDAACVKYKQQWYMIAMLDDEEKLARTLLDMPPGLFSPIITHNGFQAIWSRKDSFTVAWNEQLLLVFPKTSLLLDEARIKELLGVRKEHSLSREKTFTQSAQADALAWFYASHIDTRISAPSPLKGYVEWDSCIHVFATDNITAPYPASSAAYIQNGRNYIYADTGTRFINSSFEALLLVYLPGEADKLKASNIHQHHKLFSLGDKKTIEVSSITYAYDENFTKQKIVTTRIDTIRSAALRLFDPNGNMTALISNDPDTTSVPLERPEPSIKLMAHFNQELLSPLYPFPASYDVRFIQTGRQGFNNYELLMKPGNLKQLADMW